jgi:chromate transporter
VTRPANASQERATVLELSCWELFLGFLEVASRSFGGAAAWTRFVLVDRRAWLTDAEFTEAWGIAQLVPGPNVINLAVHLGDRAQGARGVVASFAGIMLVPSLLVLVADSALMHWIHIPLVQRALLGLGAAAAGLVFAMGLKMGDRFRRAPIPLVLAAVTFFVAGPMRVPLPVVVMTLGPLGMLWAWRHA